MATFEQSIHAHFDARIATLARIKSRSLGGDVLTLTALKVLVYAQLEGGMKDLVSCVLRHLNHRKLSYGEIRPNLLGWRNASEIEIFRSVVNFQMVGEQAPFANVLAKRARMRPINRRYELNQINWTAIRDVYTGLGLDTSHILPSKTQIDQILDDRNRTAHHGVLPQVAVTLLERQLRDNVLTVETILTDLSLQLLSFFARKLHRR